MLIIQMSVLAISTSRRGLWCPMEDKGPDYFVSGAFVDSFQQIMALPLALPKVSKYDEIFDPNSCFVLVVFSM